MGTEKSQEESPPGTLRQRANGDINNGNAVLVTGVDMPQTALSADVIPEMQEVIKSSAIPERKDGIQADSSSGSRFLEKFGKVEQEAGGSIYNGDVSRGTNLRIRPEQDPPPKPSSEPDSKLQQQASRDLYTAPVTIFDEGIQKTVNNQQHMKIENYKNETMSINAHVGDNKIIQQFIMMDSEPVLEALLTRLKKPSSESEIVTTSRGILHLREKLLLTSSTPITKETLRPYLKKRRSNVLSSIIQDIPKHWVERDLPLNEFKKAIKTRIFLTISGIAGSGKTQFIYRCIKLIEDDFKKSKKPFIVREFVLNPETDLEEEYRRFASDLALDYLDDNILKKLNRDQLFQEIKDGLDLEYSDSGVLLLYDNVDDNKDIDYLNELFEKEKTWFQNRGCHVLITSQKPKKVFSNSPLSSEISLNEGLILREAIELLDQKEVIRFLEEHRINVDSPSIAIETIQENLNKTEISSSPQALFNEAGRENKRERSKKVLELIQLFDALPLGLLISKIYLTQNNWNIKYYIEEVTKQNNEMLQFMEDFANAELKEYYKKPGSRSQLSAICLMIEQMDKDTSMPFKAPDGIRPSDVLQWLSLYSCKDIPDILINKFFSVDNVDQAKALTKRFIYKLTTHSLRQDSSYREFHIAGNKETVHLISLHGQTQFAAQTMAHKRDLKEKMNKAIVALRRLTDDLNNERHAEMHSLVGQHFFHLLEYISQYPADKGHITSILVGHRDLIIRYLETNYRATFPRELVEKQDLENLDGQKVLTDLIKMKMFENIVNCSAETGAKEQLDEFGQKAESFFNKLLLESKLEWDADSTEIILSMIRIYLHRSQYGFAKKWLNHPAWKTSAITSQQVVRKALYSADICFQEQGHDSLEHYNLAPLSTIQTGQDRAIILFRKASLLLYTGDSKGALSILNQLIKDPEARDFISDVKIARLIAQIKADPTIIRATEEEVWQSMERESDKQETKLQFAYLMCVLHIVECCKLAKNNKQSESQINRLQSDQFASLTMKTSQISFDFIFKNASVYPVEWFLLYACFLYYTKNDNDAALFYLNRYFSCESTRKFSASLGEFNSNFSRRLFYFVPNTMQIFMGAHIIKLVHPYHLQADLLEQKKDYYSACKALVLHLNQTGYSKITVITRIYELFRRYAQQQLNTNSYPAFITLTDKILPDFRTPNFYGTRVKIGLLNQGQLTQENIKLMMHDFEEAMKKSLPQEKCLLSISVADFFSKEKNYEKAYFHMKQAVEQLLWEMLEEKHQQYFQTTVIRICSVCAEAFKKDLSKNKEKIDSYTVILSYDPKNVLALLGMSDYYQSVSNYQKAIDNRTQALTLLADSSERIECYEALLQLYQKAAQHSVEAQNFQEAVGYLEALIRLQSEQQQELSIKALEELLDLYQKKSPTSELYSKYAQVLTQLLERKVDWDKDRISSCISYIRFLSRQQPTKAIALTHLLLGSVKQKKLLSEEKTICLFLAEQFSSALCNDDATGLSEVLLEFSVDKFAFSEKEKKVMANFYYELARFYERNNQVIEDQKYAIVHYYRLATNFDPKNPDISTARERHLKHIGANKDLLVIKREKYQEALKSSYSFWASSSLEGAKEDFFKTLITCADAEEDNAQKVLLLEEARELKSEDREIHGTLFTLYYSVGSYQGCLESHDKFGLDELSLFQYLVLIESYIHHHRFEQAEKFLKSGEECFLESNTVFKYFQAILFLSKAQSGRESLDNIDRQGKIEVAKKNLNLHKLNVDIGELKELKYFTEKYRQFYIHYATFLSIYQSSSIINQLNHTLVKTMTDQLDELEKTVTSFSGELQLSSRHPLHRMGAGLKMNITTLKIVLSEPNPDFSKFIPYLVIKVEQAIKEAIDTYTRETAITSKTSTQTDDFKKFWAEKCLYFFEDITKEETWIKYRLLLKWFFDWKPSGRFRRLLEEKLNQQDLKQCTAEGLKKDVSFSFNTYERDIEMAVEEYKKDVNSPSTASEAFVKNFYTLKFSVKENEKTEIYEKLVDEFIRSKEGGTLKEKLNKYLSEKSSHMMNAFVEINTVKI